jgi:broad specificity phosphatase PhoE
MRAASEYLENGGNVAILDATNASRARRQELEKLVGEHPILYVECVNDDPNLLLASIQRKVRLPEFARLSRSEAIRSFVQRIHYYESIYAPLGEESNFLRVDTLHNKILKEQLTVVVPYYVRIRDIMVSDWVNNLYLVRHGETHYNLEGRIGGDSPLTEQGLAQSRSLADHFRDKPVPYIFISAKQRSKEYATALMADHPDSVLMELPELDEIDAESCEGMTYEEIRRTFSDEFAARARDKYHYVYPGGEGYVSMYERVNKDFRKALFLSGAAPGTLIIGHQAVNRVILSLFLYRHQADVPYIYVPQDKYYHIVATHHKKHFELVRFMGPAV